MDMGLIKLLGAGDGQGSIWRAAVRGIAKSRTRPRAELAACKSQNGLIPVYRFGLTLTSLWTPQYSSVLLSFLLFLGNT